MAVRARILGAMTFSLLGVWSGCARWYWRVMLTTSRACCGESGRGESCEGQKRREATKAGD